MDERVYSKTEIIADAKKWATAKPNPLTDVGNNTRFYSYQYRCLICKALMKARVLEIHKHLKQTHGGIPQYPGWKIPSLDFLGDLSELYQLVRQSKEIPVEVLS